MDGMKGNSVAASPRASRPGEENPMAKSRKEFLRRWIPMGVKLWAECEGHQIDWRRHRLEELDFLITLAEVSAEGKNKCARM